jgi:hypothetical protein
MRPRPLKSHGRFLANTGRSQSPSGQRRSQLQSLDGSLARFFRASFECDELSDNIADIGWQRLRQHSRIVVVQTGTGYGARPALAITAVQN